MTEEQKLKMAEGRAKNKADKEALRNKQNDVVTKPEVGSGEENPQNPIAELSGKMDAMVAGLNSVGGAILKLIEMQSASVKDIGPMTGAANAPEKFTPRLEDETYPKHYIPPKFRKIVDTILSEEFGLRVMDFEDRTDFQIDIIVPDKFSSVSKEDKDRGVQDIRSRIIPRAMGENGVREWCELIRRNLNKFYQKEGVQSPFTSAL